MDAARLAALSGSAHQFQARCTVLPGWRHHYDEMPGEKVSPLPDKLSIVGQAGNTRILLKLSLLCRALSKGGLNIVNDGDFSGFFLKLARRLPLSS